MKRTVFLFLLTACGSPFSTSIDPPPDAAPERTELPETGPDRGHHEAGHHHTEAGRDREIPDETGPTPDTGHDAPLPPPVDSGSDTGCSPPSSYQYKITSGGSTFVGYPSPAQCQCASTYDCACLLASPGICTSTFGAPIGCTAGSELTVDCTP